eukprot:89515-Pyramimonas_sp.AAC.1
MGTARLRTPMISRLSSKTRACACSTKKCRPPSRRRLVAVASGSPDGSQMQPEESTGERPTVEADGEESYLKYARDGLGVATAGVALGL